MFFLDDNAKFSEGSSKSKAHKNILGFWCFNPGFWFNKIQSLGVRSIILTSGTLSPMKPFAFELQTTFQIELENLHVINPEQVFLGVLSYGK